MAINCGLIGAYDQACVHGHSDSLSVDVSGFGKTLLIDPGRYMYEGPYRVWFESTEAHNTVVVDGKNQSEMQDGWLFKTMAVGKNKKWVTNKNFDFFDGSHDGYERLNEPVTHRRRILFVKPYYWIIVDDMIGKGEHDFDLYYHFPEKTTVKTDSGNFETIVGYGDDVFLSITPCGTEDYRMNVIQGSEKPIQGWVSYDYAVKLPAPVLRYSKRASAPVRFTTILNPFKGIKPELDARWIENDVLEITSDNSRELVIFSDGSKTKYRDIEFDGELLYVRYDTDMKLKKFFSVETSHVLFGNDVVYNSNDDLIKRDIERSF